MSSLIETDKGISKIDDDNPVVSAEILLASIVNNIGPQFMVVPIDGWKTILKTLSEYDEKYKDDEDYVSIVDTLNNHRIPMIPVSLVPKKEESHIVTPNSNIVMP